MKLLAPCFLSTLSSILHLPLIVYTFVYKFSPFLKLNFSFPRFKFKFLLCLLISIQIIFSDEKDLNDTDNIKLVKSSAIDDLPFSKKVFVSTGNPREDELISVLLDLLKKLEKEGGDFTTTTEVSGDPLQQHFYNVTELERAILREEEHRLKSTIEDVVSVMLWGVCLLCLLVHK